jgi:hypothetical protein
MYTQVFTEVAGRPLNSEAEFHDVRRAVMACPVGAIQWKKRPKLKATPLQEGYPKVGVCVCVLCVGQRLVDWLGVLTRALHTYTLSPF